MDLFVVNIQESIHQIFKILAVENRQTLSSLIEKLLQDELERGIAPWNNSRPKIPGVNTIKFLNVPISRDLHRTLKFLAIHNKETLASLVDRILQDWLERRDNSQIKEANI